MTARYLLHPIRSASLYRIGLYRSRITGYVALG